MICCLLFQPENTIKIFLTFFSSLKLQSQRVEYDIDPPDEKSIPFRASQEKGNFRQDHEKCNFPLFMLFDPY